jgi:hypothetical protein
MAKGSNREAGFLLVAAVVGTLVLATALVLLAAVDPNLFG